MEPCHRSPCHQTMSLHGAILPPGLRARCRSWALRREPATGCSDRDHGRRRRSPARSGRVELFLGGRGARRNSARHRDQRQADVRRVSDSQRASDIPIRSCWCTAAAARARIGCVRRMAVPAGPRCWCKKVTRFTWSIAPATAARRFIPIWMARSRSRTSRSIRSRACSRRSAPSVPIPRGLGLAKLHNQWPGTGEVGSADLAQLVASQGGSYVANIEITHTAWRERGAELLDKIGPAIIMTHSAGGPFGYLVAEVRPKLVKGIVVVEGAGTPFGKGPQASKWGITTIPMTYDPPVKDPSELKTKEMPVARARRGSVPNSGRARAQAEKPAGHSDCAGDVGSVVRIAWRSRRARVPEAGRLHGRRIAPGAAWRPRQRPHDDGGEKQSRGAAADSRLVGQERLRARRESAGREEESRSSRVEAVRTGPFLGGHRIEEDALRHHRGWARCTCSICSRRRFAIHIRWCWCMAAAARARTTWDSATASPAGSITICRQATRFISWIGKATGAHRIIRMRSDPSVRC